MVTTLPSNETSGLAKVCDDDKFAYMCSETIFKYVKRDMDCEFVPLKTTRREFGIGFDLPKNSPYLGLFNVQ